jgi:hypothetical protein
MCRPLACLRLPATPRNGAGRADRRLCRPRLSRDRYRPRAVFYRGVQTPAPFSFRISLSPCPCSGGESNSRRLISPGWHEPSSECPWTCGPPIDMKIVAPVTPAKASSADRRFRGPRLFRSDHRHRALLYRRVRTPASFSSPAIFLCPGAPAQAARATHRT